MAVGFVAITVLTAARLSEIENKISEMPQKECTSDVEFERVDVPAGYTVVRKRGDDYLCETGVETIEWSGSLEFINPEETDKYCMIYYIEEKCEIR